MTTVLESRTLTQPRLEATDMDDSPSDNSSLAKNQELIYSWIGACLLTLQNCERLVRMILAGHEISGPLNDLSQSRELNQKALKGESLGTNVNSLFRSYFQKENSKERELKDVPKGITAPYVNIRVSVVLNDDDYRSFRKEMESLVQLRNKITHHFLEMFNIATQDGCEAALSYLKQSHEKICAHHATLLGYAQEVESMADRASSPVKP